jgi:hypothetical protein
MRKLHIIALLSAIVLSQCSCFRNFYDTRSAALVGKEEIETIKDPNKLVIIHFDDATLAATHVIFHDSTITADLRHPYGLPGASITPSFEVGTHAFRKSKKDQIESQVHVFANGKNHPESLKLSLPVADINQVQTYAYNQKKSTTNHILSALGIVAIAGGSVMVVYGIIYAFVAALFTL